ncbi:glycosyltransferase [Streptococcus cuniculipharyngis]|uniref:Glycosyltransferase n=1 Tax=Streptococcus cuniculipharyngis TaxID=1562651 RepID=A0A5C5SFP6_9STRE|nr:glycosyltransferase [Streptococcus cuniculipharyngis]TWS98958.1 glycosyltransferase [Streptococcus cuniculipharyngis]
MEKSQPLVSIICTSYNYAAYIAQAFDGFLAQKTSFPFEIIVVDDCSTDHSMEIIEGYKNQYPDLFRVFVNDSNQGITKTWLAICQEARGKYIARCDADDYWIDPYKLQKQVDLLENSADSRWCNTEFNIVDEENKVIHPSVFANGPIAYANTYEKMLATKGMTLTSSWLVESDLMREVNALVDPEAVDDGFPMQLEFFKRTRLSYIAEPTVAYRMTQNSDSRPQSEEKALWRINGLLATQLTYIDKYPEQDMTEMVKLLVKQDAKQEERIYHFGQAIHGLNEQIRQQSLQQEHLRQHIAELEQAKMDLNQEKEDWQSQYHQLKHQYEQLWTQYNGVISSRRWTIPTKLINMFRRKK